MLNRSDSKQGVSVVFLLAMVCFCLGGCLAAEEGCVACHTDKEKLKEIADPIHEVEDTADG